LERNLSKVCKLKSNFIRILFRMKRKEWILTALFVIACFVLARSPMAAEKEESPDKPDNIRIVRVITTQHGSDLQKSKERLMALPGVVDVEINEKKREVIVHFDIDKTTLKNLDEPLRKAGFIPWYH
jgi:ABC-type Na+ efflux pump permease subunit